MKPKPKIKAKPNAVIESPKPGQRDLRDIIDWSHQFQMIYSGVENESYFELLYSMGIRDFLMSHHYITKKGISLNSRFKDKQDTRLFVDSGAFTYMTDPEFSDIPIEEWESLLQKYLAWAKRNKEHIFAIANFDFEYIVGATKVAEWNLKYFEPFMLETDIPVCFVWHPGTSFHTWEYYCERYPYVGFSSVTDTGAMELEEYHTLLRTAEKYDAVVHGFGMTKTSMLTELPFYTSDSTTWLVGLQYGEINYWNGTKMSRLKKDKWKGQYLDTLVRSYNLNRNKLLEEDPTEMIKANIHAFMDAQEYINTRLISRMYWLKPRTVKRDLEELPDDFYPTVDWFLSAESGRKDYKMYAKAMNINPEYEGAEDLVCDATAFLNWRKAKYKTIRDFYDADENRSLIDTLHEKFINRIVLEKEDKVNDLIKFFRDCVSGANDRLLHLGTNFDRIVKERETYVEEDDTELVDISESEVQRRVKHLLPSPENTTEEDQKDIIGELDDEIYEKAEIIPVRDSKGRLLKGQVEVRKPKKMYSDKYPKYACDTCRAAAKCPEFKQGFVCAYNKMFNRYDTRDMVDIIQAMQGMVGHNLVRMQKAMLIETITGENSVEVTQYINQNMNLLDGLRRMYETGSEEVLSQTKIVRADGTTEETTRLTNPKEGGILAQIFSNLGKSKDEDDLNELKPTTVEVEGTVESEEEKPQERKTVYTDKEWEKVD